MKKIVWAVVAGIVVVGCNGSGRDPVGTTGRAGSPAPAQVPGEGSVVRNTCPHGDGRPYFVQVRHDVSSRDTSKLDFEVRYTRSDGKNDAWAAQAQGKGVSNEIQDLATIEAVAVRGATITAMRSIEIADRPACEVVIVSL